MKINTTVNQCNACKHRWIPRAGVTYTHCTSAKCRVRWWDRERPAKSTSSRSEREEAQGA